MGQLGDSKELDMISGIAILFLMSETVESDPDGQWTLNYSTITSGPVTTYAGMVRLSINDETTDPCFEYVFEYDEGEVVGPETSCRPGEPMLPFDWVHIRGQDASVVWCESANVYQTLPVEVPRFFNFSVRKTSFGPDDLTELLAQWGQPGGWDLDGDGIVSGTDLNTLLTNWKIESGET
tara:strand:- start:451 stop:990 length:540 start_codon:yes stop_codon:yes gene_type:complete